MKSKKWLKKAVMGLVCGGALLGLAACGSSNESSNESSSDNSETLTIDVYNSVANYMGIQGGWFGELVKDKFNIELNIIAPNVAGNGDTLYQTRTAAGDLGDLIIINNGKEYNELVQGGLLYESSELYESMENLKQYDGAVQFLNEGQDGIYGFPTEVSTSAPDTSSEGLDLNVGPYLRWDLYKEVGYPEMNTLEDLLPILQQMQEAKGTTEDGKRVYSFSLFSDWDGDSMSNAVQLAQMYGYNTVGYALARADGSDIQGLLDDDSEYMRALKFYYEANQMGLVDPESTTQNYDTLYSKFQGGQVLYSWFPWLGQSAYNTTKNMDEGVGFMLAPIKDQKNYSDGAKVNGGNLFIGIGSNADDPQRISEFIDWLYSPEGIMANSSQTVGGSGPEGLTWEVGEDGAPVLTDFGKEALIDGDADVPEEFGGGSYKDGGSALNFNSVLLIDENPNTGYPYNFNQWDSYAEATSNALKEDWSSQMGGASSAIEFLQENDQIMVAPGATFVTPEDSSEISTLRSQIGSTIKEFSWKMVFASNEEEFEQLKDEMQKTAIGLGYEDVLAVDIENAENQNKAREEIMK